MYIYFNESKAFLETFSGSGGGAFLIFILFFCEKTLEESDMRWDSVATKTT